ncbi:MAG TPA: tripartite tricarboxylate transporter substrate binding protein [Burkholderiales bacterium]|nr:tripartite tricarboxylate transporter substrate binding protein [Burkholderiales bacterium]
MRLPPLLLCPFAVAFVLVTPAMAAEWKPANPLEIVVPNAPGGGNDAVGRLLQRIWQERRLTPTNGVVVNKTGGGGTVALNYLGQKANDPHAIAVVSITQQLNYIVGSSPLRHRDFTPLAVMIGDFIGFAVRADSPIMTGRDLIERLKKDPASLTAGVTAIGGNNHIAYVLAARAAGADTRKLKTPVFQSSGESLTALLGGHIDLHMGSVGPLTKHLEAGRVRIVAVTSDRRLSGPFAVIPTWKEQGIAGTFNTWRGLWAPKGLSVEQIVFWDDVLEKVSRDAQWKESLDANHWESDYRNSRDAMRYLDGVHVELRDVLKELGLAKRVD